MNDEIEDLNHSKRLNRWSFAMQAELERAQAHAALPAFSNTPKQRLLVAVEWLRIHHSHERASTEADLIIWDDYMESHNYFGQRHHFDMKYNFKNGFRVEAEEAAQAFLDCAHFFKKTRNKRDIVSRFEECA